MTRRATRRVLIVEDHRELARVIAEGLDGAGFRAEIVGDGRVALERLAHADYQAVVLDWMLPGLDGRSVLRRLREEGSDVPVVMLTARDEIRDRVSTLDEGADDYVVKPFALEELLARLRAVLRRHAGGATSFIDVADLRVDTVARTVHRSGREILLSSREYLVLECLALNRGRIVSRDRILAHAYAEDEPPASNVVEVYVGHLRRKIDSEGATPLLHTRRGLGYVLGEAP
jgi:two-component system copper resistance phosphate regulon response regulator CusR